MREEPGKREAPDQECSRPDRWLWLASGVFTASLAAVILSDLLPGAMEGMTAMALLALHGLYGAVILGLFLWGAVSMLKGLRHARLWGRLVALCLAVLGALAFVGALSLGLEFAGLSAVAVLQLLTPVLVVFAVQPRSAWCVAAFGAATALASGVVYILLYAMIVGIEGGYLMGDAGPGLSGLHNVMALLCLVSLAVFPVIITLAAGAIGGIVGWMLRCRLRTAGTL